MKTCATQIESKTLHHIVGLLFVIISIIILVLSCNLNSLTDMIDSTTSTIPAATTTTTTVAADIYEADNTKIATTNTMAPGDATQDHTFHVTGDEDWIILDLSGVSAGTKINIQTHYLSDNTIDTVLSLYDSTVTLIADNNDYKDEYSKIVYICDNPGTYYIKVNEYQNDATGYYRIDVQESLQQGDIYEYDDFKWATANTMIPGDARQDHTIHYIGDEDWIILDLSDVAPGTNIKIETYKLSVNTNTDLYLYNSALSQIAHNDDNLNIYSQILYTCDSPETYYVKVKYSAAGTGDYSIDVQEFPLAGDIYEPDNSDTETTNILVPDVAAQEHTFHVAGDEDWITLDFSGVTPGNIIKIQTYFLSINTDTVLYFYDSDVSFITFNDDSDGIYSKILYTCDTPGTYYLRVNVSGGLNMGDYSIDVEELSVAGGDIYEPDNSDNATTNTITPGAAAQDHTFHIDGDVDWFILDLQSVTPGTDITIETYFLTEDIDTVLTLYNSNVSFVYDNDDKGGDAYSRIIYTCNTPGIYYIKVNEFDGSPGDYSIDVQGSLPQEDIYENDNSDTETANTMSPGDANQDHTLHTASDEDWIILDLSDVSPDTIVRIKTKFLSINTDTSLHLYDSSLTQVSVNDDYNGIYSRIIYFCKTPGIYYVKVTAMGGSTGNYTLNFRGYGVANDIYEPDNSDTETTNTIVPDDPVQDHDFDDSLDEDWIILDLSAVTVGTNIKIETYNRTFNINTALWLYNSVLTQEGYNDDFNGLYSRIMYTCNTPGIYYIKVIESGGDSGDYSIDVLIQ